MITDESMGTLSITDIARSPARFLAEQKMGYVLADREAILARVARVSSVCADVARNLIDEHCQTSPAPPLGEIWPLLLADLAGVDTAKMRRVSQAWLAIYLYTLMLDRHCDEPQKPEAAVVLTGTVLFEIGLGDLLEITSGTPWANEVRSSVHDAIRSQLGDLTCRGREASLDDKRKHAAAKNSGFFMCVAAIAAVGGIDPGALRKFTSNVLLALQHLDDIGDFEPDYLRGHFTPLLSSAAELSDPVVSTTQKLSRSELLTALIKSQALYAILAEARTVLRQATKEISAAYDASNSSPSRFYLSGLDEAIGLALGAIQDARPQLLRADISEAEKKRVLLEIERQLTVVAQQS